MTRARPLAARATRRANLRMRSRRRAWRSLTSPCRTAGLRRPASAALQRRRAASSIPPPERLLRADAERRDAPAPPTRRGAIDERKQQIAAVEAERCAAFEKVRHVGAERRPRSRAARSGRRRATAAPSARSAAAASLLPPPRPACSGIRFVRSNRRRRAARRGGRPPARPARRRARQIACRSAGHAGSSQVSRNGAACARESSACRAARSTETPCAARG